jgi:cysteine desulfurase
VIDLDNNATSRPTPEVVEAMVRMLTERWHNPSAVHRAGQMARQSIDLARASLARLIGARPRMLTFTGSGTEAIDLAIRGSLRAREERLRRARTSEQHPPDVILTSPVEHGAVRELVEELGASHATPRYDVRHVAMDAEGVVRADSVRAALDTAATRGETVAIVTIQWANNETGAVHPVHDIGALCRSRGVLFHCDATQWVGKMPTCVDGTTVEQSGTAQPLSVDLLTFSPHKFHGPKGVGVVYARPGVGFRPLIRGEQELGRRGGTENVPGIVGAGVAADLAMQWLADPSNLERARARRDRFEREVRERLPESVVNGPLDPARRLWNTSNISFPRLEAEALLLLLSERPPGVCASAGAACSSGSLEPSPVLRAMGIAPETAHGALRFSLSRFTTDEEITQAIDAVVANVQRLRKDFA